MSEKKCKVRKSISIDLDAYETLKKIKNEITNKLGGRITFNMVVQSLINDHNDLINIKSEIVEIRNEANKTNEYIKDMLKLALSTSVATTNNNSGFIQSNNNTPMLKAPPTAPPVVSPPTKAPKKITYRSPNSGNLKKDYINEIKQVFNGSFVKPSDILKITKPKHLDSVIKEIDENTEVPDIFERSSAKNFKKLEVGSANV